MAFFFDDWLLIRNQYYYFFLNKYVGVKETFVRVETLGWDWSEFIW